MDREARAQKQRNDYVMYIDYHRIQNGFQVTRFSLPFSALVYGLHIRAPLYPCSRSRWADKTSSKKWTCDIFQRPSFKMCHDIYIHFIYCVYIYIFFVFHFYLVSFRIIFFFVNAIHRSRYIYIFFFVFVSIIGWFVVFCFIIICHYYRFIVYFFKISSMKISSVKERKKKRESARERSIGFVMSFARVWTNCLFDVYYY